jgi:hypothetical protein
VASTYGDWDALSGACEQLAINLTSIVLAGVITLFIQRRYYVARRRSTCRIQPARLPAYRRRSVHPRHERKHT